MTFLALGRGRRDVLSAFSFKSSPSRRCQRECGVERADIIHSILRLGSRGAPFISWVSWEMSSAHAKYTVISLDKQYRINCAEVAIENVNTVNATTRGCHAKPDATLTPPPLLQPVTMSFTRAFSPALREVRILFSQTGDASQGVR
jgi:hypothetical protein